MEGFRRSHNWRNTETRKIRVSLFLERRSGQIGKGGRRSIPLCAALLDTTTMSVEIEVHGHEGLRAKIAEDGAVHDCKGVLLGYINEDGSAGDAYVQL